MRNNSIVTMLNNLSLLQIPISISSLIKDLETCLEDFERGETTKALDTLDQVEENIESLKEELQQGDEPQNGSEDLIKHLESARQSLSWIRTKEENGKSP